MQHSIELTDFPGINQLTLDLVRQSPAVSAWFDYPPHAADATARRLAELDERQALDVLGNIDRGAWAAAVYAQNQRFGSGAAALDAARRLGQPRTYTVVTGQQAGLLGGPLYTLLKAVTVVKLAQQLKQQFADCEFVPLFWISSDDSDFDEVRTAHLLDASGQVQDLQLPAAPEDAEALIVGRRELPAQLAALLSQLDQLLPGGKYRDETLQLLHEAYGTAAGGSLVTGFARLMAWLFEGTQLLVLDPGDPVLMQAARPLIKRELNAPQAAEAALLERNQALRAAGYPLQVEHLPGDTSLFLLDAQGRREKLAYDAQGFYLRRSGQRIPRAELETLAEVTPERFVLGVMLRPVYQNELFPCAAWVGGAAEIAYRAQGTAMFHWQGCKMAPLYLRASATLLPAKSATLLHDLGWGLRDMYVPPQDLSARAAARAMPAEIEAALARYRDVLFTADAELRQHAAGLDPSLETTFATLRGNLEHHVEKLEKKITGVLKQQQDALLKRVQLVQAQAYPRQLPQERLLCAASLLPRYGRQLVAQLLQRLEVPAWKHQVLVLE